MEYHCFTQPVFTAVSSYLCSKRHKTCDHEPCELIQWKVSTCYRDSKLTFLLQVHLNYFDTTSSSTILCVRFQEGPYTVSDCLTCRLCLKTYRQVKNLKPYNKVIEFN